MTRRWYVALAALAIAVALAGGLLAVNRGPTGATAGQAAQDTATPDPTVATWPRAPDTLPTVVPTTKVPGPPADTDHVDVPCNPIDVGRSGEPS